jgi:hypothetical protein
MLNWSLFSKIACEFMACFARRLMLMYFLVSRKQYIRQACLDCRHNQYGPSAPPPALLRENLSRPLSGYCLWGTERYAVRVMQRSARRRTAAFRQ